MFGNGKVTKLEAMMREKDDEIYRLWEQLSSEGKRIDTLKEELSTEGSKISTLKKHLRKQNSADMLVNAFEAVGIIPTEKKKDHLSEQNRLMTLQQQYGRAMTNASGQQQYNSGSGSIF